jgi:hypothetical protein
LDRQSLPNLLWDGHLSFKSNLGLIHELPPLEFITS